MKAFQSSFALITVQIISHDMRRGGGGGSNSPISARIRIPFPHWAAGNRNAVSKSKQPRVGGRQSCLQSGAYTERSWLFPRIAQEHPAATGALTDTRKHTRSTRTQAGPGEREGN